MARIKIANARLSFPSLFRKASFQEGQEGKYEATLIVPKKGNEAWKKEVDAIIEEGIKEAKLGKVSSDKKFIKDGDEDFDLEKYPEYENSWIVKASNNKRPTTIAKDKTPVVEEDELFYAGCYVNASIEPWYQNNSYGKRVNANLLGVQFSKDGEPFGAGAVDVTDDFDDIDDL